MPCLLEDDPNPDARAREVATARSQYLWDPTYLAPLPMLEVRRTGKHPGILEFLRAGLFELPPPERADDDMPEARGAATLPGLARSRLDELRVHGERATDPSQYLRLLEGLGPSPNVAGAREYQADWDSDAVFAWQRLAGPNPMTIERPDAARWTDVNARLGLDDDAVRRALGDPSASVGALLSERRLLVSDYGMLVDPAPVPCGVTQGLQKFLPAPIGAFAWDPGLDQLLPLAIRRGQTRAAPLSVRGDPDWAIARTELAVADFDWHEMGVHLLGVHFLLEGFVVASRRTLPTSHPVMALLLPHFKYTLLNNFAGRELLVEPGGYVEKILAGELAAGSLELVRRAYARFTFDDLDVPRALAARGLADAGGVPVFPYRDDGLLLWAVLGSWIRSYLAAYYVDDAAVARDAELERWCRELTAADGAHVAGFPERLASRDALADALTRVIFLASAQHAAVNYAQQPSMLVIPNLPGAAWSGAPAAALDLLPPFATAQVQVEAIWLLTCYQYGRLGQYGAALGDPRVAAPLAAFQAQLGQLEALFAERDATVREGRAWPFLRPSRVPSSANI